MRLLGLHVIEEDSQDSVSAPESEDTLIPDVGEPQLEIVRRMHRRTEPRTIHLDNAALMQQYQQCLDDIFQIIASRKTDAAGKIQAGTITVKLGVDMGGKIGWFVEGRVDVAFAFEVQFNIME